MDADFGKWSNEYGESLSTPELRPPMAEYTVCYPNTLHAPSPTFPMWGQQHPGLMLINHDHQVHPPPGFHGIIERTGVMNEIRQLLINQRPEAVVGEGFQHVSSKPLLGQVTVCDKAVQTLRSKCCGFCRKNGETPQVYRAHYLTSPCGKLTCPILRKYVCPLCKATGDDAHTVRYCPKNREMAASSIAAGLPRARQRIRGDHPPRPKSPSDKMNISA